MTLLENQSLKGFNTFGIDAKARYFAALSSVAELTEFLGWYRSNGGPLLILGGGSNVLFSKDFPGTAIEVNLKGIRVLEERDEKVLVRSEAGEVWDDFVAWCVDRGFGGVENLSLIPGNVGSAPIQNIGAYGADVKDVISRVTCLETATGKELSLNNEECRFDYRESIFKRELKGKVIITGVEFRLWKVEGQQSRMVTESPGPRVASGYQLKLGYGNIRDELKNRGILQPSIRDVREVICDIRRSKLPDPSVIGNAGSFFKNPRIPVEQFDSLKTEFPGIPGYPDDCGIKVPAGWLIEQCGWKGKRIGDAGVHEKQALVLVNFGNATGKDILELASKVRNSVRDRFGIELEIEVNVV